VNFSTPIVVWQVSEFPIFHRTDSTLTFSKVRVSGLCPETDQSSLHPSLCFFMIHFNISLPFVLSLPSDLFTAGFLKKTSCIFYLSFFGYMTYLCTSLSLDHPNNVWWNVGLQILNLVSMQLHDV
jgi:hypothetical protein